MKRKYSNLHFHLAGRINTRLKENLFVAGLHGKNWIKNSVKRNLKLI